MSGRIKKMRADTNATEPVILTLNEKILKECHDIYIEPQNGLVQIAASVKVKLLAPRKKINILLIGNHSAGKSTFINWYLEEQVLRTGVAIETQGFALVTSGKKRESLTGNATLHLYPHFKPLGEIKGLTEYIVTEISTSKQKKFNLVTFIDTPGLVDGDMNYPFEVERAIMFLGNMSDLIFVFFDPIGQALCKRTLNLVEALNVRHSERIKLFLSKADEAGHEGDRQKVLMQIVQELCKRPSLNKAGFDLPTIFIPNPNKPMHCANRIEEVCMDIEKTINRTVQNTLNALESDCNIVEGAIQSVLSRHESHRAKNWSATFKAMVLGVFGSTFLSLLFIGFVVHYFPTSVVQSVIGENMTEIVYTYSDPVLDFWYIFSFWYQFSAVMLLTILSFIMLYIARRYLIYSPTLSRKRKKEMLQRWEIVKDFKNRKHEMYQDYLRQSVADHEM